MTISALGVGMSGLQSYQRALDISANNVANALTTDFQSQQATFQDASPAGSGVSVINQTVAPGTTPVSNDAPSGTDLATEMVNQLVDRIGFEASAKTVKTSDQILGTLVDTMV